MSKSLKTPIALAEMLLEALKDLENFNKHNKSWRGSVPEQARVERLRVELQKELYKALKK